MTREKAAAPVFLSTKTILPVNDIYETTEWYGRVLGLQTIYIHGEGRRGEAEDFANYAIMVRDHVEVHFILDEDNGKKWTRAGVGHLGLTVSDIDAVYASVKTLGTPIARELQQENWPARGFSLVDPSGNDLHIEQPTSSFAVQFAVSDFGFEVQDSSDFKISNFPNTLRGGQDFGA